MDRIDIPQGHERSGTAPTEPHTTRRRGSTYILVLSISMIVMVIGLSALTEVRVQRRTTQRTADAAEAALYAQSAIEYGFSELNDKPGTWRSVMASGSVLTNADFGAGTISLTITDPNDGQLDNDLSQSAIFHATGMKGDAVHIICVEFEPVGDGYVITPGSWTRAVN